MAKKNNTAEKTVLDAEKITAALKEGTEKKLRSLVNEAVSNLIKEDEDEDELEKDNVQSEDDSYEVEDVDAENDPVEDDAQAADDDNADAEGEDAGDLDDSDADDEWSDLEKYKVGDNDYDFTGVDGETALKVFNKLGDDDEIFVTKNEDGDYEFKDDETGAEYVIELNPEEDADADNDDEADDLGIEVGDDDANDDELEIELDSTPDDELEIDLGDEDNEDNELEIDLGDEDEEEELNEEDLGYTDSYQKDVFAKKPNMSEPADNKTTNDWDEGAPKGAEKPWAGKGDGKPFEKQVNECGAACAGPNCNQEQPLDEGDSIATQGVRKMVKTKHKQHRPNNGEEVKKVDSPLSESKARKIVEAAKAIQAENKQYKSQIDQIKKSLYEAAVLNVNLGKIVSLFVENTTTRAEKKAILERFENVKTIKDGTALYETIKKELNEGTKSTAIMERQISMAPSLNETTIYTQSNPSLDMMKRMDALESYYKG